MKPSIQLILAVSTGDFLNTRSGFEIPLCRSMLPVLPHIWSHSVSTDKPRYMPTFILTDHNTEYMKSISLSELLKSLSSKYMYSLININHICSQTQLNDLMFF